MAEKKGVSDIEGRMKEEQEWKSLSTFGMCVCFGVRM